MNNILVTGIGGNVGYGILKNIRSVFPLIRLIGTNTNKISAGNHICDDVYEVPYATDETYIPAISEVCRKHNIDLIIPSTDYETYALGAHADKLPTVAASPADTCRIFLDKYVSYKKLNSFSLPFAKSILPADYNSEFEEYIVKPREGRGSRNIFINPANPKHFDDSYVIQPLLKGKEITTAFYITIEGSLHGLITMERHLSGGATNTCEVVADYDADITGYIKKMIANIDIKGSCNIQSIVTQSGIIPFEVNCRISGTNSIRSQFGFNDVQYTVEEYLYHQKPSIPRVIKGSAIRILYDIIYPDLSLTEIKNNTDNFLING